MFLIILPLGSFDAVYFLVQGLIRLENELSANSVAVCKDYGAFFAERLEAIHIAMLGFLCCCRKETQASVAVDTVGADKVYRIDTTDFSVCEPTYDKLMVEDSIFIFCDCADKYKY